MTNWDEIRAYFPALARNVYLNTAGGAPLSVRTAVSAKQYYDEGSQYGEARWNDWLARVEETRTLVANFINAPTADIAFLPNVTLGLNIAAQLFAGEGEVVSFDKEFPSVTLPWLAQKYPVRLLPTAADGSVPLATVAEALTPATKVLVLSHVQYATGYRHDLGALGTLCRERGVHLVVDATQSLGAYPIDVAATPVSILTFSGYKWPTAGYNAAAMYIPQSLLAQYNSPVAGWRSARSMYAMRNDTLDLADTARVFETGHPPFPGVFALKGALELLTEIGMDNITARIIALNDHLHAACDAAGLSVYSTRDPHHRSGITMVAADDPPAVAAELAKRNIIVSARGQGLRVSPHFYNTFEEIERFVEAMVEIGNQ